jgi:long-chain acyl-CoA synthetase
MAFESIPKMLHWRIALTPDAPAFEYRADDQWHPITWAQSGQRVRHVACGLHALGLEKGDRCAILSNTSMEWVLADLGILCAGGAVSTIYPSNTPAECRYIVTDSGARFCFAEDADQVEKLRQEQENTPTLEKVFVFEGGESDDEWVLPFSDLVDRGKRWDAENPGAYEEHANAIGSDDLATLIYTSGTTGQPKGVMLVHDCWCVTVEGVSEVMQDVVEEGDKQYLFLPLSHSYGKVLEFIAIRLGVPTAVHGDVTYIVQGLAEVRPSFMGAVPRVFEKVYNKIVSGAREKGPRAYAMFQWAVGCGREVSILRQQGAEPGLFLRLKYWLARKLVFDKIKAAFGGRIRIFNAGGAPLAKEIAEFFHAADLLIVEGYGLTETSAASFGNRVDQYKFGTVGLPNPGVEVKVSDDGEVLLRGRGVMRGYYNMPEATTEALEPDGWFHTGDLGSLDEDGFLTITGRKKELIVTAGGKNIAPAKTENLIKSRCPYVSQVVVHGDRRNFCVALVTVDEEAIGQWAAENKIPNEGYADLSSKREVRDLVWGYVEDVNTELPSFETIKYIHLLDHDLSIESGELTPTLKVKRNEVEERYKEVLDGFYKGTVESMAGESHPA